MCIDTIIIVPKIKGYYKNVIRSKLFTLHKQANQYNITLRTPNFKVFPSFFFSNLNGALNALTPILKECVIF